MPCNIPPHQLREIMSAKALYTLTDLCLTFHIWLTFNPSSNLLDSTLAALKEIPNKRILESFSMRVDCHDDYEKLVSDDLEKLDAALSHPAMTRLCRVEIVLVFYHVCEQPTLASCIDSESELVKAQEKDLFKHLKQLGRNEALDLSFRYIKEYL
ncbi:hypothetical protein B0H34DRAFT_721656 [Crassisporium funariophilum]|nr:hypothetical protein B0H34DRAFT_721656 [Crassisporium funariophilum]